MIMCMCTSRRIYNGKVLAKENDTQIYFFLKKFLKLKFKDEKWKIIK